MITSDKLAKSKSKELTNKFLIAEKPLFDETLLDLNKPFQKPVYLSNIQLKTPPEEIKRKYKEVINELYSLLDSKNIKDETIRTLETITYSLSLLAIILPIIMTAVSGVLIFLTQNWLTALVNLANAVPPFFINMYKTKTENWYKGSSYKFSLKMLEVYINRIDNFTEDILRNIDMKLI